MEDKRDLKESLTDLYEAWKTGPKEEGEEKKDTDF